MKEKGEIAFTEDIIREAASRTGKSVEEIRELYDFTVKYIRGLARDGETSALFIPNLGTIFQSNYILKKRLNRLARKGKEDTDLYKNLEELNTKMDKHLSSLKERAFDSRHLQKEPLKNPYFTKGMRLPEIEEKQNSDT